MSVLIIGASSGPGRLLFDQLCDEGFNVTGIARSRQGAKPQGLGKFIRMDATNTDGLAELISKDTTLVHCSRPEILTALLARKPTLSRLIALGSTRIYTRFPDDKCQRLSAMAHEIGMGNFMATLLHPTMIVGAPGFNNIERIMGVAKISPIVPLPGAGEAKIQPVTADDVVRSIRACMNNDATIGRTIVLAGHQPLSYRVFVETCIEGAGLKSRVVNLPYPIIWLLSLVTQITPGIPSIGRDEVQRLLEDKDFDVTDMMQVLGVTPTDTIEGLKASLNRI